ncbi:MAG: hypothetical protein GX220_00020, partial [Treponema sp.]|nr:hypothetical protein [Treponema sp.]
MANETIGIKLADGSFYPILTEGIPAKKYLDLTTARDNQTTVQVNLYRSPTATMDDAVYMDTLVIENLLPREKKEHSISFSISIDENDNITAEVSDPESGGYAKKQTSLISLPQDELTESDFTLSEISNDIIFEDVEADVIEDVTVMEDNIEDFSVEEDLLMEDNIDNIIEDTAEKKIEDAFNLIDEPVVNIFDDDFPTETVEDIEQDILDIEEEKLDIETEDFEINVDSDGENDFTISDEKDLTIDDISSTDEPDFDMPVFDEIESDDETTEKTADFDEAEMPDFDMPNFDETDTISEDENSILIEDELPNFDDIPVPTEITGFAENSENEETERLFDFDDDFEDNIPSPAISFTDLYDEDRIENVENDSEGDEVVRKTTVPVTICILCAAICVIVLLLLLFFSPVKVFLTGKNSKVEKETVVENVSDPFVSTMPLVETEPVVDNSVVQASVEEAKVEEIVKVETTVVEPVVPAPVEKPKNIIHRIRWGDTLWDIS